MRLKVFHERQRNRDSKRNPNQTWKPTVGHGTIDSAHRNPENHNSIRTPGKRRSNWGGLRRMSLLLLNTVNGYRRENPIASEIEKW